MENEEKEISSEGIDEKNTGAEAPAVAAVPEASKDRRPSKKGGFRGGKSNRGSDKGSGPGGGSGDPRKQVSNEPEYIEKVLSIRRVTKVTKGGKKLSFSALVVVGDGKGHVGYSMDKAGEVATAIRKAMNSAKKQMVKIPIKGTTIPHEIIGAWGGARVLLKPAAEGTGVIACGPVRAVCDGAGIHNILTKCHRSNNPNNVVKATMNGLTHLKTVNKV